GAASRPVPHIESDSRLRADAGVVCALATRRRAEPWRSPAPSEQLEWADPTAAAPAARTLADHSRPPNHHSSRSPAGTDRSMLGRVLGQAAGRRTGAPSLSSGPRGGGNLADSSTAGASGAVTPTAVTSFHSLPVHIHRSTGASSPRAIAARCNAFRRS